MTINCLFLYFCIQCVYFLLINTYIYICLVYLYLIVAIIILVTNIPNSFLHRQYMFYEISFICDFIITLFTFTPFIYDLFCFSRLHCRVHLKSQKLPLNHRDIKFIYSYFLNPFYYI